MAMLNNQMVYIYISCEWDLTTTSLFFKQQKWKYSGDVIKSN